MFSKVKPAGWAFGEILTSAQMNQIDTNLANAVDGVGGGTYTLSSQLIFAGQTVKFNGLTFEVNGFAAFSLPTTFGNGIVVTSTATLNGALNVAGDAAFAEDVTLGSDINTKTVTVNAAMQANGLFQANGFVDLIDDVSIGSGSGNALTVASAAAFGATLSVAGTSTLSGNTVIGGNANLNGATSSIGTGYAASNLFLDTTVTLSGPVTMTTAGRIKHRALNGVNSNQSYSLTAVREVFVPSGTLTADRTYQITNDAGNSDNEEFTLTSEDTHNLFLVLPDGVTQIANLQNSLGSVRSVTIKRISGTWRILHRDIW